jgi:hypothetical protein
MHRRVASLLRFAALAAVTVAVGVSPASASASAPAPGRHEQQHPLRPWIVICERVHRASPQLTCEGRPEGGHRQFVRRATSIREPATPITPAGPADIAVGPDYHLWLTENGIDKIATVTP